MKLYTEEQVKEAYNKGRTDWINEIEDYYIFSELTPIELPSDEEIKQAFESEHYNHDKGHYRKVKLDRIYGAKWMREQIFKLTK